MSSKIYFTISIFFLTVLISGCQLNFVSKKEDSFTKLFPISEMNTKLQFESGVLKRQKLIIGSSISLVIKNNTNKNIAFPSKNLKIYTYDTNSGAWLEIPNLETYIPDMQGITPRSENSLGVTGLGISPNLYNKGKPVNIRVVVVANIYEGYTPTDEQVGAYIDLTLKPN